MRLFPRRRPGRRSAGRPGFFSAEVIILIAIVLAVGGWFAADKFQAMQANVNRIAADQARTIARGGRHYIDANRAAVQTATASGPIVVTVDMMAATNALPAGMEDVNAFGQTWCMVARRSGNVIESMLVATGGIALSDDRAGAIAELLGGGGGYIRGASPGTISGMLGGWTKPVAEFSATGPDGPCTPGPGRPAYFNTFAEDGAGGATALDGALYRHTVPGAPEAQTMDPNTEIRFANQPATETGLNTSVMGMISRLYAGRYNGSLTVDGNVAVGTASSNRSMTVYGTLYADDVHYRNAYSTSDIAWKEKVKPIDGELVDLIRAVRWNWKSDGTPGYGFIAQDLDEEKIRKIAPGLVDTDPVTGKKRINYTALIPFLFAKIQEMEGITPPPSKAAGLP